MSLLKIKALISTMSELESRINELEEQTQSSGTTLGQKEKINSQKDKLKSNFLALIDQLHQAVREERKLI